MRNLKINQNRMLLISLLWVNGVFAADDKERSASLQQQVDIQKKEMIELGRDIRILEEVLLYPTKSRVSVYLTMDVARLFALEKVKLLLNDKIVAEYIYSTREVKGFGKGSSQRLYVGNMQPGKYKLTAIFSGKGPRGRVYKRGVRGVFVKENEQKIFEINVEDDERKQQPVFYIRDVS